MSETDAIPEFKAKAGGAGDLGITNMSALTSGPGIKSMREVMAIVLVAVIVIGGTELLLNVFAVPQYVLPKPSEIGVALITEFPLIAPHLGYTLVELFGGFAIGASVGLILAGVITQYVISCGKRPRNAEVPAASTRADRNSPRKLTRTA